MCHVGDPQTSQPITITYSWEPGTHFLTGFARDNGTSVLTTTLEYDSLGRVATRATSTYSTTYSYLGASDWLLKETLRSYDGSRTCNLVEYRYLAPKLLHITQRNELCQGGESYFMQFDWHGNLYRSYNAEGAATTYSSEEWGNRVTRDYSTFAYRWNGQWGWMYFKDLGALQGDGAPFGLYYAHGRWYSPETGLWLSANGKGDYFYGGDGQDTINLGVGDNKLGIYEPVSDNLDNQLLAYGIKILPPSVCKYCKVSRLEKQLTLDVVMQYARLLGGSGTFQRHVALNGIAEDWLNVIGQIPTASNTFYDWSRRRIVYQPNSFQAALLMDPNDNSHFLILQPITAKELFANDNEAFSSADNFHHFIVAHEMTHALVEGSPELLDDFQAKFFTTSWWIFYFSTNDRTDPLSVRNKGRGDEFNEILADVIASDLYAPSLLSPDFVKWIDSTFPLG